MGCVVRLVAETVVAVGPVGGMNRWRKPVPLERVGGLFELVCAMGRHAFPLTCKQE